MDQKCTINQLVKILETIVKLFGYDRITEIKLWTNSQTVIWKDRIEN